MRGMGRVMVRSIGGEAVVFQVGETAAALFLLLPVGLSPAAWDGLVGSRGRSFLDGVGVGGGL